jgi:hypothetical protein
VADNFIHRCGVELVFNLIQGGNGGIRHPVALNATDVVVLVANPVIPFQDPLSSSFWISPSCDSTSKLR